MDRRPTRLVLASGSTYRAGLLAAAGIDVVIDPPDVDERALDHLFDELGAQDFALELARRKSESVRARHLDAVVIAADQVGVLDGAAGARQLTKQPSHDAAVAQLMEMSGTEHRLVNGLVVVDTASDRRVEALDEQVVTMRRFSRSEAEQYVSRFEPFDSSGSYRLEDQEQMAPLAPFVVSVVGEHDSGVLGLPMPLLARMLGELGLSPGG